MVLRTFVGKLLKKSRGKDMFGKLHAKNVIGKIQNMNFDRV